MNKTPWAFRGAQLDLARQMETAGYIRAFIDFIARRHFNVLVLYLEARIRTPSFPWPADEECYTQEQIREIVAYAGNRGIEVVPVVSNLGHAEGFLKHQQLSHLAELREGVPGRFQQHGNLQGPFQTICPSLPATWEFFESYYSEIAELFPSNWFHVGCDENWDFCCCSLCRLFAQGEVRQAELFGRHLLKTHEIVTGKLGKRMIIWDDMLTFYPSALDQLPRDIVMATWLYDDVVDLPQGHFGDRSRKDKLAAYQARGIDYLVAPCTVISSLTNVTTLTKYAARHQPLGGLLTTWEKTRDFMAEAYPTLAYAGKLWNQGGGGNADEILRRSQADLFPSLDESQRETALLPLIRPPGRQPATKLQQCLAGPLSSLEYERAAVNRRLGADLAALCRGNLTPEESLVLEDLLLRVESESLALSIRSLAIETFQRINGLSADLLSDLVPDIQKCRKEVQRLALARSRQWKATRPGLPSPDLAAFWRAVGGVVDECEQIALGHAREQAGILRLQLVLPNQHGSQRLSVAIRYSDSQQWVPLASEVFKPLPQNDGAFYEVWLPMASHRAIAGCKLESWGYGGMGVTYVEAINPQGQFIPVEVTATDGKIRDAGNLLADNLNWAWIGEQDADVPFFDMAQGRVKHSIDIALSLAKKD